MLLTLLFSARYIRHEDRASNAHQYPKLTFPEVYILDGGYSAFFQNHKLRCSPQNYVEMNDKEHANACERDLGRIKQQRGKIGRAQTFAFGQKNQALDESPTAAGRPFGNLTMGLDFSTDYTAEANKRANARRMASY